MVTIDSGIMPYKKITVTNSETVKFTNRYTCFAVKDITEEGSGLTVSLTESGQSGDSGVIDTADLDDKTARFFSVGNTDTLYITGSGTALVWSGYSADDCPFKKLAKGGEEIEVTALNVTENGTYTAPSGTAYSPVVVDTGIYTGATTPASTLGKDGDYYYQRTNDFGALILKDDVTYRSSSTTWIGFDFTTTKSISITKIKTRLSNPTSIIYRIATENEILYESDTIEGIAGENEITLATPLRLAANVAYTAYVILGTNYGYYYGISDVIGTGKTIVYNNGRYGENSSGTRPYKADASYGYAVDFEYKTDDAYIISEYRKKSGSWVEL